jgi:hypothetical protein
VLTFQVSSLELFSISFMRGRLQLRLFFVLNGRARQSESACVSLFRTLLTDPRRLRAG